MAEFFGMPSSSNLSQPQPPRPHGVVMYSAITEEFTYLTVPVAAGDLSTEVANWLVRNRELGLARVEPIALPKYERQLHIRIDGGDMLDIWVPLPVRVFSGRVLGVYKVVYIVW